MGGYCRGLHKVDVSLKNVFVCFSMIQIVLLFFNDIIIFQFKIKSWWGLSVLECSCVRLYKHLLKADCQNTQEFMVKLDRFVSIEDLSNLLAKTKTKTIQSQIQTYRQKHKTTDRSTKLQIETQNYRQKHKTTDRNTKQQIETKTYGQKHKSTDRTHTQR